MVHQWYRILASNEEENGGGVFQDWTYGPTHANTCFPPPKPKEVINIWNDSDYLKGIMFSWIEKEVSRGHIWYDLIYLTLSEW